jgi:hypothetical protein
MSCPIQWLPSGRSLYCTQASMGGCFRQGISRVTKREKLILYPNSGRGAYFPAHGEPVLKRAKEDKQRMVVMVNPWWMIASEPSKYLPMYVTGREEPLYFEVVYQQINALSHMLRPSDTGYRTLSIFYDFYALQI